MSKAKKYKTNKSEAIRKLHDLGHNPKDIHTMTKYSKPLISVVLRNYKKKSRKSKIVKAVEEMKEVLDKIDQKKAMAAKPTRLLVQPQYKDAAMKVLAANDLVNSPPHYTKGGIEYWDFAEAKGLTENAYLFNAGKYIVRCGKKEGADPIQDLEKAIKFIQRDIDRRKRA
jgi:hypothetical protein